MQKSNDLISAVQIVQANEGEIMKLLVILFVAFFSSNALAAKIISVNNSSNQVILDGKYAPVIIAGTSGRNLCTEETSTLNTCGVGYPRATCNFKTVCPTTELGITISAKGIGNVVITDTADVIIHSFGLYKAGQNFTATLPWSVLCRSITGMKDCSFGARTALKIGLHDGSKLTESTTFILQISYMENNYNGNESISGRFDGIADYTIAPGSEKAILTEITMVDDFMISNAGKILGFRSFMAPGNCMSPLAVSTASDSFLLKLNHNKEIEDNRITGLNNGTKYLFMLGLEDEAGNIGYFKDLNASCVEGKHTATPHN